MDFFAHAFSMMDTILMPLYRLPDSAIFGYYMGTLFVSLLCVIAGECSFLCALRFQRYRIADTCSTMDRFHELSIEALRAGDRISYEACNRISKEAYGKRFFSQITLSAAVLWPALFGLGWMQYRFSGVDFHAVIPVFGANYLFGYITTFAVCYGIAMTAWKKIKHTAVMLRYEK